MAQFKYTISTPKGKTKTGTISASNRANAQRLLSKNGNLILAIQETSTKKKWYEWSTPLGQKDIMIVTKRISDMTKHGFSVIDALNTLQLQSQNPSMKELTDNLKHQIELGNSLSESLGNFPNYFSNVYISLVKVGEESGTLPEVLKYLEKQEKQMYMLKQKALSAMVYPSVILGLMIAIAIGMIVFLIPFLREIFSSFQADLPLPTRILLRSEEFLRNYWWALLGGLLVVLLAIKYLWSKPAFQNIFDRILLSTPFVNRLVKTYNSARIIRTFATLNKTEVPMIKSLEILITVPNNTIYQEALKSVKNQVDKGEIFSAALEKHPKLFSGLIIESVKLGEKSGNLAESMQYLAEIYEQEVKSNIRTLTKFIQPLLLILVGVMVAGFALSIIVPLQKIPTLLQQ